MIAIFKVRSRVAYSPQQTVTICGGLAAAPIDLLSTRRFLAI
jgi:hypothetical protein